MAPPQFVRLALPLEFARCIAGENACPPQDVGAAGGYEEFLEALSNPDRPDHADLMKWIGRPFDPRAFDLDEVNARQALASEVSGTAGDGPLPARRLRRQLIEARLAGYASLPEH